ncbi:MYORG-like protein [Mya arenaria]|uniref:MYORG-like protein n=1 Tax=Mya arenaria TaxID=6604 RepID=A0ABY7EP66_MYAAR|nr:MYORG-like protein [Mya arenaria]
MPYALIPPTTNSNEVFAWLNNIQDAEFTLAEAAVQALQTISMVWVGDIEFDFLTGLYFLKQGKDVYLRGSMPDAQQMDGRPVHCGDYNKSHHLCASWIPKLPKDEVFQKPIWSTYPMYKNSVNQENLLTFSKDVMDKELEREGNLGVPDRELYIRWLSLAAYMPCMAFSFPPWMYSEEVMQIAKKFIDVHKNVVAPHVIKAAREYESTGAPVIRPLWWSDPIDPGLQTVDDQFTVGDDLLVAPVLSLGQTHRDVLLPHGRWRDELSGKEVEGKTMLQGVHVPLGQIATYTRINPTSASISTTTTPTPIHPTSEVVGGHLTGQIPVGSNLIIFNDSDAWNHGRITGIRMLCGQYLLAMAIQYNGVWAQRHGFWAGNCATNQTWTPIHFFEEDEWIQHAELTGSWFTSSVTFTTNKRRLETCGIPEAVKFREGGRLEFVSGKFGCFFDRLQLHWSSYVSL